MEYKRVNLPGINKPYGREIRSCLIAPLDHLMGGFDIVALEDSTKQHFIYYFDPEYVKEMRTEDFDPHLSLGVLANLITEEEEKFYKNYHNMEHTEENKEKYNIIKNKRHLAKTVNFACLPQSNTEILTKEGWRYFNELHRNQIIYSYSIDRGIEEDVILQIITPSSIPEKLMKLYKNNFSIYCTLNHRWLKDNNKYIEAVNIEPETTIRLSGEYLNKVFKFSNKDIKVLGWILASTIQEEDTIAIPTEKYYLQHRIEEDLKDIPFSLYKYQGNTIYLAFRSKLIDIYDRLDFDFDKIPQFLFKCNSEQLFLLLFIFTLVHGKNFDFSKKMQTLYNVRHKNQLEFISLVLLLSGYSYTITNISHNPDYVNLRIYKGGCISNLHKKYNALYDHIFCLQTKNNNFIIRQGKNIMITGNSVYGAGVAKIASTAKISMKEAQKLYTTYWNRNKAVKTIEKNCEIKTVNNKKWLYNPVSGFWIFLPAEKDKFSALNQSTGNYVFNTFLKNFKILSKQYNIKVVLQYHDEGLFIINDNNLMKEIAEDLLNEAMKITNEELALNVEIKYSLEFGKNYGECH